MSGRVKVYLPVSKRSIYIDVRGDLSRHIQLNGITGYKKETIPIWMNLWKNADLIIDIGAHIGIFSVLAADSNQKSRIMSFEPITDNYLILNRNITEANFTKRIFAYNIAISNRNGYMYLFLKGSSGSTLEKEFWQDTNHLDKIKVRAETLDYWLDTNNIVISSNSIIKIDIETHEPAVFSASPNTLKKGPAILCEVLATFTDFKLAKYFPPHKWRYFWIGPDGLSERRMIIGDPSWKYPNYLFLTHDSPFLSQIQDSQHLVVRNVIR